MKKYHVYGKKYCLYDWFTRKVDAIRQAKQWGVQSYSSPRYKTSILQNYKSLTATF